MTPDTQRQTSTSIVAGGLFMSVLIAIPAGFIGIGLGWNAAAYPGAQIEYVSEFPQPVPQALIGALSSPEPDYLNDPAAMRTIKGRVAEGSRATGRFKYLHISADRTVVAIIEIEGDGIDSVVFSWGQTIHTPQALTEKETNQISEQVFELSNDQLAALPSLIDELLEEQPNQTTIESISISRPILKPYIEINFKHPRKIIPSQKFDLDRRPL